MSCYVMLCCFPSLPRAQAMDMWSWLWVKAFVGNVYLVCSLLSSRPNASNTRRPTLRALTHSHTHVLTSAIDSGSDGWIGWKSRSHTSGFGVRAHTRRETNGAECALQQQQQQSSTTAASAWKRALYSVLVHTGEGIRFGYGCPAPTPPHATCKEDAACSTGRLVVLSEWWT